MVAAKTHGLALAAQFPAAAVARIAASSQGCALELIIGLRQALALPDGRRPSIASQYGRIIRISMIATNVHTRRIAEFVSGLTYEQIPAEVRERIKLLILDSLGCAIYGADLEWCRILRTHARSARRDAHHVDLGHRPAALVAACGARQRHAGAGLRARRRAPPGRAACRRGDAAGADRGRREPRRH